MGNIVMPNGRGARECSGIYYSFMAETKGEGQVAVVAHWG
ncbi:hypothetical protein yberc0001_20720 [Yersinia bercovieri ATCC 43970]|uniref:Uncharacterized protein n=1 Tax=Yersinia bercovieri ATCC 43970 TaxID=349968 RepID=A0ABM9XW40_YERBE|nr:hypothetical protein yberc0001_20720 [Yersinia bercovieri ATCC 43970]